MNDVASPAGWTGFHRIEQYLWARGTTQGTKPYGDKLVADVTTLDNRVKTLTFQPAQLANGAVELLNEVANSKITGEEDRYSHTDLSDFAANIEGAHKAFVLLRPALVANGDKGLAETIDARFAAVAQGARQVPPLDPARLRRLQRADAGRPPRALTRGRRAGRAALHRGRQGRRLTGRSGPVGEPRLSRRRFLAAAGGGAVGLAAAGAGGYVLARDDDSSSTDEAIPFYGAHQAGIATAAQDRLVFGAFDLTLTDRTGLAGLLRDWTTAAATMSAGEPLGRPDDLLIVPPVDTGEALGLPASRLTITFGFGPGIFAGGRFGLARRRPEALVPLPHFAGDELDPDRSGGDLCVQACSDDPVVAFHAVRNLARVSVGRASLRWTQLGFGRTSSTTTGQDTLRNLQGFKDGTNNLRGDDEASMTRFVWVGDDEPQTWLRGGTFLVARRIRMRIEVWDRSALGDQQDTIGRYKESGAPLTGVAEHDPVDLDARQPDGTPVIPLTRAHPPRRPGSERRRADPAPRLLVHRRDRPRDRPARRRAVLRRVPARPSAAVRPDPATARRQRRPERVHRAHRERALRRAARSRARQVDRRRASGLRCGKVGVRTLLL